MKKITPLISVDQIEPCLDFWTALGMEIIATVPHADAIGFAMLQSGEQTLMYQSRASLEDDLEAKTTIGLAAELSDGTATLFVEVESIDDVLPNLAGAPVVVDRRTTFYGMDEIFVRAPCGTLVGFAARAEEGSGAGEAAPN